MNLRISLNKIIGFTDFYSSLFSNISNLYNNLGVTNSLIYTNILTGLTILLCMFSVTFILFAYIIIDYFNLHLTIKL